MKKDKKAILDALNKETKINTKFFGFILNKLFSRLQSDDYEYDGKVAYTADMKTLICCMSDDKEIVIPEGVEEIGDMAFHGDAYLEKITFPSTLKKIGKDAFSECQNLEEITIPAYIDVGGGSTEISLIHDGTLADSHSYNIGTLRLLAGQVTREEKDELRQGLTEYATRFGKVTIIGSGGNINKLCKLGNTKKSNELAVADLQKIYDQLKPMSVEQRMETYGMRTDRADVIVPAAEIFLHCAEYLECDTIKVPNISLADSIVDGLYKEMSK